MRVFGFRISGINLADDRGQAAFVFATSDRAAEVLEELEEDTAVLVCVDDRVGSVDTMIEPFRMRERHSNYSFSLPATTEVGRHFFRKAERAISSLIEDAAPGDTTMHFAQHADSGVNNLDVIGDPDFIDDGTEYRIYYVGSETIYIAENTHVGGGEYEDVVRGAAGSRAQRHSEGGNVFDDVPFWIGRRIETIDWTPENGITIRDIGRIAEAFRQSSGWIEIQTRNWLDGLDRARINQDPSIVDDDESLIEIITTEDPEPFYIVGSIDRTNPDNERIYKTRDNTGNPLEGDMRPMWLQMRDHLVPMRFLLGSGFDAIYEYFVAGEDPFPANPLRSPSIEPQEARENLADISNDEITPLFAIVHPSVAPWVGAIDGIGPSTIGLEHGRTVNENLVGVYPYHPVAIAAAFLMSTDSDRLDPNNFDVLSGNLGLDRRRAFSPGTIDHLHSLIARTPDMAIDQMVVGWNREPEQIMDRLRRMLLFFGFRFGCDNQGFLTIEQYSLADVADYDHAIKNEIRIIPAETIDFEDGSGDRTTSIGGTFRQTPWLDGRSVRVVSDPDAEKDFAAQARVDEMTLDAPFIWRLSTYRSWLQSRAIIQDFQIPRLRVAQVEDHLSGGLDYSVGGIVLVPDLGLENPWLWDSDGERISDMAEQGDVFAAGIIIGRRYLPRESVYELEMLFLFSAVIRWRAPSAIIEDVQFQTSLTHRVIVSESSNLGATEADGYYFSRHDQVAVYELDGTPVDIAPGRVFSETGDGEEFLVNSDDDWVAAGLEGKVLELNHIKSDGEPGEAATWGEGYWNPGQVPDSDSLENIDRAYMFFSRDSDATLGDENLLGDEYGG